MSVLLTLLCHKFVSHYIIKTVISKVKCVTRWRSTYENSTILCFACVTYVNKKSFNCNIGFKYCRKYVNSRTIFNYHYILACGGLQVLHGEKPMWKYLQVETVIVMLHCAATEWRFTLFWVMILRYLFLCRFSFKTVTCWNNRPINFFLKSSNVKKRSYFHNCSFKICKKMLTW